MQLLNVSGQFTASGNIIPSATGNNLGSTTARWDAFLEIVSTGQLNGIEVVDGNRNATIQSAHDNLPSTGGYIFVPAGDRTLPSDLTLSKPVTIIAGVGTWTLGTNRILYRSDNVCIIGPNPGIPDSTTGQLILDYNGTTSAVDIGDGTTGLRGVCLKNLRIQANAGTAQGSATAVGLKTTSVSYSVFDSILVDEFLVGTGWEATTTAAAGSSILNEVRNFRTRNAKFGFKVTAVVEPDTVKAWRFYGGFVWGTAVAGSIGYDFASTTSSEGGDHMLFGTECASFDIPYRVDSPAISFHGTRSETVTTAHIQLLSDAARTVIIGHKFIGAGTHVSDAGTLTLRWDVDAPISVDNRADGGDGSLIFANDASIVMKEAGGTQRIVSEMNSNNFFFSGNVSNATILRGLSLVAISQEGGLSAVPRWIFKQVDFGDMTAGATADTFTLWTLPANTMIHDVVGTVVTGWSGGSISAAVASVGTSGGSANDLTLDDDFFAAATVYELHDATASGGKGTLLFDTTDKFAPTMFVAGGVVELQMDLTGDNHANATAGQARIYILVSQPLGNTTVEAN